MSPILEQALPVIGEESTGTDLMPYLSPSQVGMYLRCPKQYWYSYLSGIPPAFVSDALVLGRCIHAALAAYFQSMLEGEPLACDVLIACFMQHWIEAQSEVVPIRYTHGETEQILQDKGSAMLRHFWRQFQVLTPESILGIEEPFFIELPGGLPPLMGQMDLVVQDQNTGQLAIVDVKTVSRKPSSTQDYDVQLCLYTIAAKAMRWTEQEPVVKYLMLVKTQEPQLHVVNSQRTQADQDWVIQLLKEVWYGMNQGVFFPRPNFLCSTCPYQVPCQGQKGGAS